MNRATRPNNLLWIPSYLAGMAVAAALATGAGLLLYNSAGLASAGSVLLVVGATSLVAGILMGNATGKSSGDKAVASAARGWLGFLVTLMLGSAYAALWELMHGFGATRWAQGLGLAVTSALPAYYAGSLWGRMNYFAASLGQLQSLQVFIGGVAGMATGGTTMLALLGQPVLPLTVFLGAAVLASAGARFQGWIFDRVPWRRATLAMQDRPELRFERWRTEIPEHSVRVLWDGAVDRALDPAPPGDWRACVAGTLNDPESDDAGVLFLGAGSWFPLPDGRPWQVCEPDGDMRALAAKGFEWDDECLTDSPVPAAPGWTVVAERRAVDVVAMDALHRAGVVRVWIGGRPGCLPSYVLDAAEEVAFGVSRYQSIGSGSEGPPRLAAKPSELWCFDRFDSSPPAMDGMDAESTPAASDGLR